MAREPAGVFEVQGGRKCFFFPVDDTGNLLAGADDMFSGDVTKTLQLPKLAQHIRDNNYDRALIWCHGWNNDPETLDTKQQAATLKEFSQGLNIPIERLQDYRRKIDDLTEAIFDHRGDLANYAGTAGEDEFGTTSGSSDDIQSADGYRRQLDIAFQHSQALGQSSRGSVDFLDIMRAPTGRMMKKRAGIIGSQSHAIRGLLAELLSADLPGGVNLLDHSSGCKLLLDAARSLFDKDKGVAHVTDKTFNSLILCQPAISRWVFSPVPQTRKEALYRPLLTEPRFTKPIVVLYSNEDPALRYLYPLGYFFSPREEESPVRGVPEKTENAIDMTPLPGANIPAAALGCHGPVTESETSYVDVLPVKSRGNSYNFAGVKQRCLGAKGNWTHSMHEEHNGKESGWGQQCFFWLWHELTFFEPDRT